jgi:hypothetical protein
VLVASQRVEQWRETAGESIERLVVERVDERQRQVDTRVWDGAGHPHY